MPAALLKRDSQCECFSENIAKFLRTAFFYRALPVAAFRIHSHKNDLFLGNEIYYFAVI